MTPLVDEWLDLPPVTGFYVYALYGDDPNTPLYIGKSTNVFSRLGDHLKVPARRAGTQRIAVRLCKSKAEIDMVERSLIDHYRPEWNVAHVPARDRVAPVTLVSAQQRASAPVVDFRTAEYAGSGARVRSDQLSAACVDAEIGTISALAKAMGMPPSSVNRTLAGKRAVSAQFMAGLLRAFPGRKFADFFDFPAEQVPA